MVGMRWTSKVKVWSSALIRFCWHACSLKKWGNINCPPSAPRLSLLHRLMSDPKTELLITALWLGALGERRRLLSWDAVGAVGRRDVSPSMTRGGGVCSESWLGGSTNKYPSSLRSTWPMSDGAACGSRRCFHGLVCSSNPPWALGQGAGGCSAHL